MNLALSSLTHAFPESHRPSIHTLIAKEPREQDVLHELGALLSAQGLHALLFRRKLLRLTGRADPDTPVRAPPRAAPDGPGGRRW